MSELAKALSGWQATQPTSAMSGKNPHFRSKFSTLQDIVDCVRTAGEFGMAFTQEVDFDETRIYVRTVLMHISGETRESRTPVISKDSTDPQKMGSAITYAKRYGLQAMFGIPADEDDDGNRANEAPKVTSSPPQSAPPAGSPSQPAGAVFAPAKSLDEELAMCETQDDLLALFNRVRPTDQSIIAKFSKRKDQING